MSKHTPGPWNCLEFNETDGEVFIQEANAAVYFDGIDFDEQQANARLISASPDLLSACQNTLDCIRDDYGVPPDIHRQLATAIAKATELEGK